MTETSPLCAVSVCPQLLRFSFAVQEVFVLCPWLPGHTSPVLTAVLYAAIIAWSKDSAADSTLTWDRARGSDQHEGSCTPVSH